eukprot:scaffold26198_cov19-Tisochrysis_lutea.AAC.2
MRLTRPVQSGGQEQCIDISLNTAFQAFNTNLADPVQMWISKPKKAENSARRSLRIIMVHTVVTADAELSGWGKNESRGWHLLLWSVSWQDQAIRHMRHRIKMPVSCSPRPEEPRPLWAGPGWDTMLKNLISAERSVGSSLQAV